MNQILGNSKFAKKKHKATFDQPIPKDDRDEADWNIHYEELKIPIDLHIKNFTNPNLIPQLDFIHKSYSSDQKSPVNQLKKSWKKAYTERSKAETSPKSNSKFLKSQTLKASPLEDFKELYENMDKKREDIEDYDNNFSVYKYKIEQMKKPAEDLNIDTREVVNDHFYEQNMLQLNYEKPKQNQKLQYDMKPSCKCQIVRSVSNWSCGLDNNRYENSIQFAYLQLIEDSQFYIYIENQFFISSLAGPAVENSVVKALLYRIRKAHKNKETFKVYVVMPLLPGFEG